jgi:hypothetical protein
LKVLLFVLFFIMRPEKFDYEKLEKSVGALEDALKVLEAIPLQKFQKSGNQESSDKDKSKIRRVVQGGGRSGLRGGL